MPTQSASLYEQLFALTTVMKQRVVDNFSGDALNERWTTWDESGTGTFAMVDAADEGFSITTSSGGRSGIGFNNKRQYSNSGSVCIIVVKSISASSCRVFSGFRNTQSTNGIADWAAVDYNTGNTNFALIVGDASTGSSTEGSTAIDQSWHQFKVETGASNVTLTTEGTLEVTDTTNLPSARLQPICASRDDATGGKEARIRYLEAYNT